MIGQINFVLLTEGDVVRLEHSNPGKVRGHAIATVRSKGEPEFYWDVLNCLLEIRHIRARSGEGGPTLEVWRLVRDGFQITAVRVEEHWVRVRQYGRLLVTDPSGGPPLPD